MKGQKNNVFLCSIRCRCKNLDEWKLLFQLLKSSGLESKTEIDSKMAFLFTKACRKILVILPPPINPSDFVFILVDLDKPKYKNYSAQLKKYLM